MPMRLLLLPLLLSGCIRTVHDKGPECTIERAECLMKKDAYRMFSETHNQIVGRVSVWCPGDTIGLEDEE